MPVRKPCRSKGCKTSPRCDHPWWLDVMHKGVRYRMPVDDFAFARGARASVVSRQEAEKTWEPQFIAEIGAGKDPRVAPGNEKTDDRPTTVSDLLKLYRARYVDVEPLKSRPTRSKRASRSTSRTRSREGELRNRRGDQSSLESWPLTARDLRRVPDLSAALQSDRAQRRVES
jgi:hypothetical protein